MKAKSDPPKNGSYRSGYAVREQRTFEDWQADQEGDLRTAEQRGICVGSQVMWRRRTPNNIILTERATVVAIAENMLTLLVKDVKAHTVQAQLREIVVQSQVRHSIIGNPE